MKRLLAVIVTPAVLTLVVLGGGALVEERDDEASPPAQVPPPGPPTAGELLDRAAGFVEAAEGVAWSATVRIESADEGSLDGGSSSVFRTRLDGEVAFPDRSRTVLVSDGYVSEELLVEGEGWIRDAEGRPQLGLEAWAPLDGLEIALPAPRLGGLLGGPAELEELIRRAEEPAEALAEGDAFRLVTETEADLLDDDDFGIDVDRVELELLVAPDGRPLAYTLRFEGDEELGEVAGETVVEDLDWGPADVEPPAEDDIDPTPAIEEEAIADFEDAPLFQLGAVPEGWVLAFAGIIPEDLSAEGCEQLDLEYTDPEDEVAGYLSLYALPARCQDPEPPSDAVPVRTALGAGWAEVDGSSTFVVLFIGETAVQVDTDLPVDEVVALLERLEPLDLATVSEPEEAIVVPGGNGTD